MSDIKCPFCNGELVGTIGHPICRNQNCVMCDDPMPQELLDKLKTTRKALDKAIWWLNEIVENHRFTPISTAEKALAEIKEITKGGKDE